MLTFIDWKELLSARKIAIIVIVLTLFGSADAMDTGDKVEVASWVVVLLLAVYVFYYIMILNPIKSSLERYKEGTLPKEEAEYLEMETYWERKNDNHFWYNSVDSGSWACTLGMYCGLTVVVAGVEKQRKKTTFERFIRTLEEEEEKEKKEKEDGKAKDNVLKTSSSDEGEQKPQAVRRKPKKKRSYASVTQGDNQQHPIAKPSKRDLEGDTSSREDSDTDNYQSATDEDTKAKLGILKDLTGGETTAGETEMSEDNPNKPEKFKDFVARVVKAHREQNHTVLSDAEYDVVKELKQLVHEDESGIETGDESPTKSFANLRGRITKIAADFWLGDDKEEEPARKIQEGRQEAPVPTTKIQADIAKVVDERHNKDREFQIEKEKLELRKTELEMMRVENDRKHELNLLRARQDHLERMAKANSVTRRSRPSKNSGGDYTGDSSEVLERVNEQDGLGQSGDEDRTRARVLGESRRSEAKVS